MVIASNSSQTCFEGKVLTHGGQQLAASRLSPKYDVSGPSLPNSVILKFDSNFNVVERAPLHLLSAAVPGKSPEWPGGRDV